MDDFAFDRPATFDATFTNPKPEGRVTVEGHFGPWLKTDPRGTAIGGNYVFEDANLDTLKGIGEITSGYKAVLATVAQPFFRRKGGGTKLPFRVFGSRTNPSFGLDVKRALLPG